MDALALFARAALDENGIDKDNINITATEPIYIAQARKYCKIGKEPECPIEWATIKYRPSMAGNVIYLMFFLVLMGGQLFYGIRKKTWTYMGAVSLGILLEIVGYIGRIMLNMNPFIMNNFLTYVRGSLSKAPLKLTPGQQLDPAYPRSCSSHCWNLPLPWQSHCRRRLRELSPQA
jgi:hypothetical protein